MHKTRLLLTGILVIVFGAMPVIGQQDAPTVTPDSQPTDEDQLAIAWIQENAIPFETTEPGNGYQDLMPLKAIIGDARVIALGEATHGTAEFITMRHRLIEFFVEEMGITLFAMETPWGIVTPIDNHLQTGEGDPSRILHEDWWMPWSNNESLAIIEWMRDYNQQVDDGVPLRLYGFDVQEHDTAASDVRVVVDYVTAYDSEQSAWLEDQYQCTHTIDNRYENADDDRKIECLANLQAVYDYLISNEEDFMATTSAQEFGYVLQHARVLIQYADMMLTEEESFDKRDAYMAANVAWFLEQAGPDSRIVIWAHNAHIQTTPLIHDVPVGEDIAYTVMGMHLREQFGADYLVIGFTTFEGQFYAYDMNGRGRESFSVPKVANNSIAHYFYSAQIPLGIVDLREAQAGQPETDWLFQETDWLYAGAGSGDAIRHVAEVRVADSFDMVLYIQETTASDQFARQ